MGAFRLCFRWRSRCASCFRRLYFCARRPSYILFAAGLMFVTLCLLSLQFKTGVHRIMDQQWIQAHVLNHSQWYPSLFKSHETMQPFMLTSAKHDTKTPSVSNVDIMETYLLKMRDKIKPGNFEILAKSSGENDTFLQYRDLAAIQAERQERLAKICQAKVAQQSGAKTLPVGESRYLEGWYDKRFLFSVMEVYKPQNFFFCPVLKVGSTFFRRLFYALGHGKKISSPFEISINTALKSRRGRLAEVSRMRVRLRRQAPGRQPPLPNEQKVLRQRYGLGDPAVVNFLEHAGKVMFTREPYSKLLSGYVDKLMAPNPYYWNVLGRAIIKKFRPNAEQKSLKCGHDVTFKEFVSWVIENERTNKYKRDTHFVPSYDQCKPCDYRYDVIGKMETFREDVSLVVAQLGYNLSQSTLQRWSRESELDAIMDSITSPYSWRRDVIKCISWEEANKRIWRKLQIRGILDRREALPMAKFRQYSTSSASFINLVKESWTVFRETGLKSGQKKEALSSAYSFVSAKDLEALREVFLLDFDLFGYNSRPPNVFHQNRTWEDIFKVK